jgi:NAD-dependent SIR2 family protein deacetylase
MYVSIPCLYYVPCQFRPFLLLLRVLKFFLCTSCHQKTWGRCRGSYIMQQCRSCRTIEPYCNPVIEVRRGLLMYGTLYTAVPPFVEYRLYRNILTRPATTVHHWYWYGTSTVVTPDARTSSAVFFFFASELQIVDTPLSCKLQTRL